MNAYIASFMLLVFNAVGLAVPATEAVAEGHFTPNVKADQTQSKTASTVEVLDVEQAGQCAIDIDSFDEQACLPTLSNAQLAFASVNINSVKPIWTHLPVQAKMADNQYVEGAP